MFLDIDCNGNNILFMQKEINMFGFVLSNLVSVVLVLILYSEVGKESK